jgi:hypothetical protein
MSNELDERSSELWARAFRAELALALIAMPARDDGTYKRDRAACEVLAREALHVPEASWAAAMNAESFLGLWQQFCDQKTELAEARAELERLRERFPNPCPESGAACDRMCLTMCHRQSEELVALRARVAELEARLQAVIDVCPSLPPHAARRVIHVMARPSASAGTSPHDKHEGKPAHDAAGWQPK